MDDLVEWLRAQLDEDERIAREAPADLNHEEWPFWIDAGEEHDLETARQWRDRFTPDRELRKIEANRRILDEYEKALDRRRLFRDDMASAGALLQMVAVVKLLALPYSDRPGYQEAWRP